MQFVLALGTKKPFGLSMEGTRIGQGRQIRLRDQQILLQFFWSCISDRLCHLQGPASSVFLLRVELELSSSKSPSSESSNE